MPAPLPFIRMPRHLERSCHFRMCWALTLAKDLALYIKGLILGNRRVMMGRAAPFFASLRPCPLEVETNTPSHFQARMVDNRGPVRPNISLGRAMPGATEADLLGALEIAVGMGGEAAIIYAGKALVAFDLSDLRKPPCIFSPHFGSAQLLRADRRGSDPPASAPTVCA